MDAPQHTHLRKIISRGFTPRAVERLRDDLHERARHIVEAAAAEGSGDFVEQVSCELPLQAIAGLLGVPQEDRISCSTGPTRCRATRTPSTPTTIPWAPRSN